MEEKIITYRITGTAKASKEVNYEHSGDVTTEELKMLAENAECQDDFVEYIHDKALMLALKTGVMTFEFDEKTDELMSVTTYEANVRLTGEQIQELKDYTQGQWSDGIGEGYEQFPCHTDGDTEYYISPWHHGQKVMCDLFHE